MKTIYLVRLTRELYNCRADAVSRDNAASIATIDALLAITMARAEGRGLAGAVDAALAELLEEIGSVAV